ncbi:hypothetical protein ACQ86N_41810 [Puia sp. P3]|uniref:hypothetical protein n=1 Tax=Puia sp. P3 TaxID=3423952 RepID=UPI003D67AD0F
MMMDTSDGSRSPLFLNLRKPSPYKSALAERLARLKAQNAAAARPDSAVRAVPDTGKKKSSAPRPKKDSTVKPDIKPDAPPAGTDESRKDSTR